MKRKTPSDNSDIEEKRGRSYNGSDEGDNSPTESQHSRVMPTLAHHHWMGFNYCKTNFNIALHSNILKYDSGWQWTWSVRSSEMWHLLVARGSSSMLPFQLQCQRLTANSNLTSGLPKRNGFHIWILLSFFHVVTKKIFNVKRCLSFSSFIHLQSTVVVKWLFIALAWFMNECPLNP